MVMPIYMMLLKKHQSPPEFIVEMRDNIDCLNYIVRKNKLENQAILKATYDSKVTPFRFYEGQRCYLHDPVAKPEECYKIRRCWRGPFLIHKITSHIVHLYNPSTDKYVKKSVHINRIKPCFQRDDIPEDDEVIENMPIVKVTFPPIASPTQQPLTIPTKIKTPDSTIVPDTTNNDNPHIIIPATLNETDTDSTFTETQHGSLIPNDGDENATDNLLYHDADKYWNALKIKRQKTVIGNIQYLIKWEDTNYPDTWTNASDVNDKLKRVFYFTHTKMGVRRKTPIKDTISKLIINIQEDDEWSDCQDREELLI